jgi:hypothetical protein
MSHRSILPLPRLVARSGNSPLVMLIGFLMILLMTIALVAPALAAAPSQAAHHAERFQSLHGVDPADAVPQALGEPLDPRHTRTGDEHREAAKADWQRRLTARGGLASLIPLSAIDPSRELLVLVPGNGMNFQDLHGLARLDDTYQVLVAISDHRRSIAENGRELADAFEEVLRWRLALARQVESDLEPRSSRSLRSLGDRALTATRNLRLIGHSFGGATGYLMLGELHRRGLLGDAPQALCDRVLFIGIDAPWRGIDVPWCFTVPGVKQLASLVLSRAFPGRTNEGNLSLVNRTRAMRDLRGLQLPDCVTHQFVTVLGHQDTSPRWRHLEPISNWYSVELARGELERLWKFYKSGGEDTGSLKGWALPFTRTSGLLHLVLTLARDEDYAAHAPSFVAAARAARTPEEFAPVYDELIGRVVNAFHGQHTKFMWENPEFLPWLRALLARA